MTIYDSISCQLCPVLLIFWELLVSSFQPHCRTYDLSPTNYTLRTLHRKKEEEEQPLRGSKEPWDALSCSMWDEPTPWEEHAGPGARVLAAFQSPRAIIDPVFSPFWLHEPIRDWSCWVRAVLPWGARVRSTAVQRKPWGDAGKGTLLPGLRRWAVTRSGFSSEWALEVPQAPILLTRQVLKDPICKHTVVMAPTYRY